MDSFVVKRTFIEVADSPVQRDSFEGGMRGRACSDSAVFDTFEKRCDRDFGDIATDEEGGQFDIEITGISDTDTASDRECEVHARTRLPCYQYIKQELPLPVSSGPSQANENNSNSASSSRDPNCGPANEQEGDGTMNQLLSENARLALENKLLRENARLAAENASLKAASTTTSVPAPRPRVDQPTHAHPMTEPAADPCQWSTEANMANWGYGGGGWGYPMPMQAAFFAMPWGMEQPTDEVYDEPLGCRRGRRQRGAKGSVPEVAMPADEERTTVMLRNLPNNYTRAMVLNMLDKEGFAGRYDFLYLPIDFKTRACLGYAFVNLVSASLVPGFWKTFDGYSRWALPSKKICGVTWSGPHQGLQAHVERYRNSPVMHPSVPEEYQPLVFEAGRRVPFPAPSKAPRAPRARNCAEGRAPNSALPRRA